MITMIYYFTGTGNTLLTARLLAREFGDSLLRPLVPELSKDKTVLEGDRIVVCFPLYFLGFPKTVMDFLGKAEFPAGIPVYAVITRGMAPMGGVRSPLGRILKNKGTKLTGLFYVTLPNNDVTLFKPDSAEEQKRRLERLPAEIGRIIRYVGPGMRHFDPEPLGWVRPFRYKPAYLNHLKEFGSHFQSDGTCTGCGICERVCPSGNITLKNGKPVWGDRCILCEGCLNWCPVSAVQYQKATQNKGRYRCSGITVRDMEIQKGLS